MAEVSRTSKEGFLNVRHASLATPTCHCSLNLASHNSPDLGMNKKLVTQQMPETRLWGQRLIIGSGALATMIGGAVLMLIL